MDGPDAVDELLVSISRRLTSRMTEVVEQHMALHLSTFPILAGMDELVVLLRSATRESIAVELDHISHGTDVQVIAIPTSTAEWARRVAQRNFPLSETLRGQRLGQALFLRQFLVEIGSGTDDVTLYAAAALRINERSFALYDRVFSAQIADAYDREREKWIRTRSAARRATALELIVQGAKDVDGAERALGYGLRRCHTAIIVWKQFDDVMMTPERELGRAVRALANELGCRDSPLSVLSDESTLWGWLPGKEIDLDRVALAWQKVSTDSELRIAVGEPGTGVDGFRLSHRQAVRARAVASTAKLPPRQVGAVMYRDVGLVAMLCTDIEGTSMWVDATLGKLARDTPTNAKLRRTLEIFLETGGSFAATGQRLGIHRNTVKYRVDQAEQICARSLDEGHLDLELALRTCRLLGTAVMPAEQ